jgi:superfamily II DNA or RNA helicase
VKQLRPYQQRAVDFLAARKTPGARALCVCPAGGGKTIIGAAALARATDPFDRIGWACNTREQVEQGRAALTAAGIGKEAWVRCVAGLSREDAAAVDFLVVDEVHHLPAASWSLFADACRGTIWGLTATPKSPDPERNFWFARFWGEGNTITIPRDEVMAGGHLAAGVVRIIDLDTPGEFDEIINGAAQIESLKMSRRYPGQDGAELFRRAQWRATLDLLIENPARNAAVVSTAEREIAAGHSVLVLVAEIEQGERFAEKIPGAVVAHSKMGVKKRREAIAAFRDGSLRCLIATSLADEGLDVPRASVLILATAGRSGAKLEQRTGRVMRPHEGKGVGVVYDFADRGAGMAHSQHKARRRVYRQLGYAIEEASL